MNASELLRIVDTIHRDKNIDKEIVFEGIEAALISSAKKQYGEESDIVVHINREDGTISGTRDGLPIDLEEAVGRIGAQTAKQVMIQKIREAERDALFDEYTDLIGQMVTGTVQRYEGGVATVQLSDTESILPRSEQIPGETHHPNERVRATVFEVRKAGSRVKVVLSRIRPDLVRRLFEQEIPEIADGVIEMRAIAREAGYRSKVAVSSSDQRVDCVGACVGVRGNRIKNIVDELAGERIDIVRWSDDMQVLIPNALQPAEVEEVILCQMLGRAIVLVREDQLSLAIGRRGQNVRLASKLCGWDIEIYTREELEEQIERAVGGYSMLEGIDEALADKLVSEGFLTYDDLSVIEPDALQAMGDLTMEQVEQIIAQAEEKAAEAEQAAAEERRRQREQDRIDAATAAAAAAEAAEAEAAQAAELEAGESAAGEESAAESGASGSSTAEADETETTHETEVAETDEPTGAQHAAGAPEAQASEPPDDGAADDGAADDDEAAGDKQPTAGATQGGLGEPRPAGSEPEAASDR